MRDKADKRDNNFLMKFANKNKRTKTSKRPKEILTNIKKQLWEKII